MEDREPLFYESQIPLRSPPRFPSNDPDDTHAIDSLIHERPRILRVKLAVLATQILERLKIRDANRAQIDRELLEAANQLLPFERWASLPGSPDIALRAFWLDQTVKLPAAARTEDVECWRDVAKLMSEFLVVWEGVQQSEARAAFLREQRKEDE